MKIKVITLALAATLFASPVLAQGNCGEYKKIVERLDNIYGEYLGVRGVNNEGNLVEVFVSEKGTWTALLVYVNPPLACITGTGNGWEFIQTEPKKKGEGV